MIEDFIGEKEKVLVAFESGIDECRITDKKIYIAGKDRENHTNFLDVCDIKEVEAITFQNRTRVGPLMAGIIAVIVGGFIAAAIEGWGIMFVFVGMIFLVVGIVVTVNSSKMELVFKLKTRNLSMNAKPLTMDEIKDIITSVFEAKRKD